MSKSTPSIPEPAHSVEALHETALALKEAVETLTKQRGPAQKVDAAVTWQDLLDLELITEDQIPG